MKKINGLIILFCLLLFGCKDNTPKQEASAMIYDESLPAEFLKFYLQFHSDSLYQIDHIVFPLKVKSDGTLWAKEDWVVHKSFDDHGGQYDQQFRNLNGLIIEYINDKTGYFSSEKRYMKASDGYQLIYYTVTNAFENSSDWKAE